MTDYEHYEQAALIDWTERYANRCPLLRRLHAIPNGGKRNIAVAKKLKAEGVRRGVPDLCLPVARQDCHGLYIEMKRQDGGQQSKEQKDWQAFLAGEHYRAVVSWGWVEAARVVCQYLGLSPEEYGLEEE